MSNEPPAQQPFLPGNQNQNPAPYASPYPTAPTTPPTHAPSTGLSIAKNPLGLASAITGAAGILLGLLFALLQLAIYATQRVGGVGGLGGLDALGAVHTVLSVLLAICAIVLGILALQQRHLPKVLAAVGITLGAALVVEVLSSLVFTIGLPLVYR